MSSELDRSQPQKQQVVLVDEHDHEVGTAGKVAAHRNALLHRAFSIFIFDSSLRMLIQQRAATKYHSPGLWSNACCGHPMPGEAIEPAARRRLWQEMGIDCQLKEAFSFTYSKDLGGGMSESEYDHVFVGFFKGAANPDPEEAAAWRWVGLDALVEDVAAASGSYTFWFTQTLDRVLSEARLHYGGSLEACGNGLERPVRN